MLVLIGKMCIQYVDNISFVMSTGVPLGLK